MPWKGEAPEQERSGFEHHPRRRRAAEGAGEAVTQLVHETAREPQVEDGVVVERIVVDQGTLRRPRADERQTGPEQRRRRQRGRGRPVSDQVLRRGKTRQLARLAWTEHAKEAVERLRQPRQLVQIERPPEE